MEKVSNYDAAKEVAKEVGKIIGKAALLPVKFFYTFPSLVTNIANNLTKSYKQDFWGEEDFVGPVVFSSVGVSLFNGLVSIILMESYNKLYDIKESRPFAFGAAMAGISLTTNMASAIYERYKHKKEKMLKDKGTKILTDILNSK